MICFSKKSIFTLLFLIIAGQIISGCVDNSALSDVEIKDPSLLKVEIQLERSQSEAGALSQTIMTILSDKNNDWVSLKNGSIHVNGIRMELQHLNNAPYYTASILINFHIDSLYSFKITLSDNSEYLFSIRTQQQDIHTFNVPASISRHDSLRVSWMEKDTSGGVVIEGISFSSIVSNPASGTFVFPPDYFNTMYQSIQLMLKSIKYGTIDTSFRIGSFISSEISIYRRVNFY